MSYTDNTLYDVIIAGGGPVGLFLACELRLARCSVLVLEKSKDPLSPLKELPFGLRGLSVPTIESFDRRDLLNDLKARMVSGKTPAAAHWMQQERRPGGHFAGIQFFHDQIDHSRWPYLLAEPVGSIAADMTSIETVLAIRADELGVIIRRGCGVEALTSSEDSVIVQTKSETFRSRWLVGCDGGRSTVRKAAGFSFVGSDPEFTGYSVQVDLNNSTALKPGRHYTPNGMYTYAVPGTIAMVDFDGGGFHRSELTRDHIEAVLRKVSGTAVTVTDLKLAATWTDRAYQATKYRLGRVLLAGDAAHIHSPLGGQGLNLGLGDAMNLGWKLATTIKDHAPVALLDSYSRERHPIGEQILDWSRAQVALMRPSPSSRALEAITRDLIATKDGATYFAERVWGLGLRYDLGEGHLLAGRSVPNFKLIGDSSVNSHLRTGRGLLLDFDKNTSLQALAARWNGQVDYVGGDPTDRLGTRAVLVRPDGVVAWACGAETDLDEVARILAQWFGQR